ncbi:OsmC family protein [Chitinophaga sp. S165]|uniref:OsmC family protein n=1 Tax=Chitinophaga sp. S165 TaxID=2135462 RepID=UPI000D7145B2|nr:OsmC family protein [Chitinophaga sp. S165]PWV48295.1 osmotically inducible protein OsmC [Chitinophaga sp. S165]
MKRTATAIWNGTIKEGNGNITTQSTALSKTQYSFKSRFEEGVGTNPEELIAAAHSGCFNMKLTVDLEAAGFKAETLETTSAVTLDNGTITRSDLVVKAKVPGITNEQFQEIAAGAKLGCPVSRALNLEMSLQAELVG